MSLGNGRVLALTYPFKQYSQLDRTKATFKTLSHEQIRLTFETWQTSEFCNNFDIVVM